MKFLQNYVKLDGNYMNHSIRATVISTLDAHGFEACHIMKLSSHKNESTIKEYAVKCPDNKRKEMFSSLSNAMQPKFKKIKPKILATSIVTQDINDDNDDSQNNTNPPTPQQTVPDVNDIKENLPNFNLEPMDNFDTIDDTVLQDLLSDNFMDTNPITENIQPQAVTPAVKNPPKTINTQVNTFHIPSQMQNFPRVPAMYFPNSNVTINYNFSK